MDERRDRVFEELAVVGKAFGSARRLELVELLAQGPRSVEALAEAAGLGLTTVSAHLQVLKLADLVTSHRQGRRIIYALAGDDVLALHAAMGRVARNRSADVGRALAAYLDVPGGDEVGLVDRASLAAMLETGSVAVLDVRPHDEYVAGHVPGATSLPFDELPERLRSWRPDRADVVAYCRGAHCVMAHDAVRLLHDAGIPATRMADGMLEWRAEGRPVAVGD